MDNTQEIEQKIALVQEWCSSGVEIPIEMAVRNGKKDGKTYVESNPVISGTSMSEAIKMDKKLMKAAQTSEEEGRDVFKKAPLNGCLSVMTMARNKAGFDPTNIDDDKGKEKFLAYKEKLQSAPFFFLRASEASHVEHKEKDWNKAVDMIVNLYDGISTADKEAVKKSIAALASAAMSQAGIKETKNLFVQSTIEYSKNIIVYIYWSYIIMEYKDGKSTSMQSQVDINKLKLEFDSVMWPYYSDIVYSKTVESIEDWVEENTTETDDVEKVCFYEKKIGE